LYYQKHTAIVELVFMRFKSCEKKINFLIEKLLPLLCGQGGNETHRAKVALFEADRLVAIANTKVASNLTVWMSEATAIVASVNAGARAHGHASEVVESEQARLEVLLKARQRDEVRNWVVIDILSTWYGHTPYR
jgi:hypothetical protein